MRYRFHTADVFTEHAFGGNQLAVFPDARGLETQQMELVTREFNISETVFVLPPDDAKHTRRLRIFTPAMEVPFAGHPTVGTAFVLASIGEVALHGEVTPIVFEEGIGPVGVSIHARDGRPIFTALAAAKMPEFGPEPPPAADIAVMLSLEVADLLTETDRPRAVSCGIPFLFVPLRTKQAIERARLRREVWERMLSGFWAPHVYLFTYETNTEQASVHSRMFAPMMGVDEDPATGAAATALAGYLGALDRTDAQNLRWVVEQGYEMGRPSRIEVEADRTDGAIVAVRVGGASVMMSEGDMDIPELLALPELEHAPRDGANKIAGARGRYEAPELRANSK